MVPNNSSLLTATKPITTDGKNNSVEYRSTKNEESNPTICGDDNQHPRYIKIVGAGVNPFFPTKSRASRELILIKKIV